MPDLLSAEVLAQLEVVEGLISRKVGLRLAALAACVPRDRVIVEIGSYKGRSTSFLAAGARAGGGARVYAVDPWDTPGNVTGRFGFAEPATREAFQAQIQAAGVADWITPCQGFSTEVARTWPGLPVGMLYVDGSHLEKDVRADWLAWRPHLAPRAIVAWDDYRTERNPGVATVVDTLRSTVPGAWEEGPHPLISVVLG